MTAAYPTWQTIRQLATDVHETATDVTLLMDKQ